MTHEELQQQNNNMFSERKQYSLIYSTAYFLRKHAHTHTHTHTQTHTHLSWHLPHNYHLLNQHFILTGWPVLISISWCSRCSLVAINHGIDDVSRRVLGLRDQVLLWKHQVDAWWCAIVVVETDVEIHHSCCTSGEINLNSINPIYWKTSLKIA